MAGRYKAAAALAVGALLLAGCGSSDDETTSGSDTTTTGATTTAALAGFPLTITNCGQTQTFQKPPSRVASMDSLSTEIMLHLGLGKAVVGHSHPIPKPFDGGAGIPSVATAYTALPVISEEYPSLEILLNASPDLVTGNSDSYTFGPTTAGGTGFVRTELAPQGIAGYTFLCKGEKATNDLLFSRYEEFGKLFGKGAEAKALLDKVRTSQAATQAVLVGAAPVRTFFYEQGAGPLGTYGGGGQFDSGLQQAGGKGIFDDVPSFPTPQVSAEQVIERNPDAILIVDAGIFDSSGLSADAKKQFLVDTLGTSVNAVRDDRFCYTDFDGFSTLPRTASTVAAVAACLHPELKFN